MASKAEVAFLLAIVGTSGVVTACSPQSVPADNTGTPSPALPTPVPGITPELTRVILPTPNPNETYPELKNLELHSSGTIITERGLAIFWFNYSSMQFDQNAAKQVYDFFETLPELNFHIDEIPLAGNPTRNPVIYRAPHQVALFLVDEPAPLPAWLQEETVGAVFTGDVDITRIRLTRFVDTQAEEMYASTDAILSGALVTQACFNTVVVNAVNPESFYKLQNMLAYSTAVAFDSKRQGHDFNTYASRVRGRLFEVDNNTLIPLLILYKNLYESMPRVSNIVSSSN